MCLREKEKTREGQASVDSPIGARPAVVFERERENPRSCVLGRVSRAARHSLDGYRSCCSRKLSSHAPLLVPRSKDSVAATRREPAPQDRYDRGAGLGRTNPLPYTPHSPYKLYTFKLHHDRRHIPELSLGAAHRLHAAAAVAQAESVHPCTHCFDCFLSLPRLRSAGLPQLVARTATQP